MITPAMMAVATNMMRIKRTSKMQTTMKEKSKAESRCHGKVEISPVRKLIKDTSTKTTMPPKNLRRSSSKRRNQDTSKFAFMTAQTIMGNVSEDQPTSAAQAMKMEDKSKWVHAMADEIKSLVSDNVFEVVEKPMNRKGVSCRWVYALKINSRGDVIRHKARLVAKGYSQVQSADYGEVSAPVVR